MLTHLPSLGRGDDRGGSSSSESGNTINRSDMNIMTARVSSGSVASPMPRRMRPTIPSPAFTAGGEAAISVSSGSTLISVSPRSAPSTAYCISLVSTTQANDLGLRPPTSPRGRCEQLVVREAPSPLGPTRHGYTGSVTHIPSVQPRRPPLGAAVTTGPQPSHGTDGAIGPAYATISSSTDPTNAGPAEAVVATTAMRISGSGPPLPSISSVRILLDVVAPDIVMGDAVFIEPLPITHHRPQRIYKIRASVPWEHGCGIHDMLVLILAPPSMLRLLRSEQWIVKSEAVVVKWIRAVLLSGDSPWGTQWRSRSEADLSCTDTCGSYDAKRQYCQVKAQEELFPEDVDLLRLLPALIDHSQSSKELGSAYSILSHLHGLSLSCFSKGLTLLERRHIDFQAGRFIRRLSLLQSPSGKFGPAISVLCPTTVAQIQTGGSIEKPGGMDRWSLAFHAILEGILRDAEDMAITLAYQAIRRHFRRLRTYLDAVTVARLVIIDAAHDSNIMAERKDSNHNGRDNISGSGLTDLTTEEDDDGRCQADIQVTGLRDWSNCTFGDPLMAMVFSEEPSREFLRGFSGRRLRPKDDGNYDSNSPIETHEVLTACGDIVEHPEEARIRMLLYQCYHATVAVVKEFYRPQSDSIERELAARKRLHVVLAKLDDIEDDPKRQHFRPRGEMSPAKKPKTEEDDGDDEDEGTSS